MAKLLLLLLSTNTKATTSKSRGSNVFLKLMGMMACSGSTKGRNECLPEEDEDEGLVVPCPLYKLCYQCVSIIGHIALF